MLLTFALQRRPQWEARFNLFNGCFHDDNGLAANHASKVKEKFARRQSELAEKSNEVALADLGLSD